MTCINQLELPLKANIFLTTMTADCDSFERDSALWEHKQQTS